MGYGIWDMGFQASCFSLSSYIVHRKYTINNIKKQVFLTLDIGSLNLDYDSSPEKEYDVIYFAEFMVVF
jgi:hypothetical protein